MSAQSPLPRLFGPYVLTHQFGDDRLGSLFRAGTASGPNLAPFVLIRTFGGPAIDRDALFPVMETAAEYLEEVRGPAVAKGAVLGIVDDVPFAGIEYVPGRTLDRLFRYDGTETLAFPIEHALLMGEKLLVALEAAKPFERKVGAPHGFLVPAFVTVSNDGDVRVFGPGLGAGLLPSLRVPEFHASYAPYVAPEVAATGKPSVAGDIYSAAAILFEGLVGRPPAPGAGAEALRGAVLGVNGSPIPDDISRLLARGLARDPSLREQDVVSYRKSLGKLLYGGPYAPSTFNLAFFMHQKFEKAIDGERKEMSEEEHIDVRPLREAEERREKGLRAAPKAQPREVSVPSFGVAAPAPAPAGPRKGGIPVPVLAGVGVAVVVGVGVVLMRGGEKPAPPPPAPVTAPVATPTPAPPPTPVIVGKEDPAFQEALQAKLAEEMKKVQDQIAREQAAAAKKKVDDQAKLEEVARKTREAEEAARLARERADSEEAARLAREAEAARQREETARKAAEAAAPKTKEGDLVDVSQVDRQPQATKIVKPEVSAMARQRRVGGTVLLRVLVDESGKPAQIEVMRDTTPRVGLAETSRDAVSQWQWQPAQKDGRKVKTWIVVPIPFAIK